MSVQRDCLIIEISPNNWFYTLDDSEGENENWLDDADVFGPFDTFETADEHLGKNHSNPGSFALVNYAPRFDTNVGMQNMVKRSKKQIRNVYRFNPYLYR